MINLPDPKTSRVYDCLFASFLSRLNFLAPFSFIHHAYISERTTQALCVKQDTQLCMCVSLATASGQALQIWMPASHYSLVY